MTDKIQIVPEKLEHQVQIEQILDQAFGVNRTSKISYRYRNQIPPIQQLCWVAEDGKEVVGTIRYWPVTVNKMRDALLLGPLAISHNYRSQGLGQRLAHHTMNVARELGYELVFLVGDHAYYHRLGFNPTIPYGIYMPDEKPERLLIHELVPESAKGVQGPLCQAQSASLKEAG